MKLYNLLIVLYFVINISSSLCMDGERNIPTKALEAINSRIGEVIAAMIEPDLRNVFGYAQTKRTVLFEWLPGYIIKLETNRIYGAKKIVEPCIVDNKLNLLCVPNMWEFDIPSKEEIKKNISSNGIKLPYDINNVFLYKKLCLAEYIEGTSDKEMSLEQVKQVVTLIQKAERPFDDWNGENVVYTNDGRVAFIDTEIRSFGRIEDKDQACINALKRLYLYGKLSEEASNYLKKEYNKNYSDDISK